MMNRGYQDNYSTIYAHKTGYDQSRPVKARKTLAVIEDAASMPLSQATVLEVGCYKGEISRILAPYVASYTAVDIDRDAIRMASQLGRMDDNLSFSVQNAEALPYSDGTFDIVICSHVYEHVPDPRRMMREIHRVMKSTGLCHFAAGNRFKVMEPHYRLPFLSWVPKPLAHRYLSLSGKGEHYYETLWSYFGLKNLVQNFRKIDYTFKIIIDPEKFAAEDMIRPGSIRQMFAKAVYTYLKPLFPTYIWVLVK